MGVHDDGKIKYGLFHVMSSQTTHLLMLVFVLPPVCTAIRQRSAGGRGGVISRKVKINRSEEVDSPHDSIHKTETQNRNTKYIQNRNP